MVAGAELIEDGEIAVEGSRIVHVGAKGTTPEGFAPDRIIEGNDMLAMPGFVNCHTHAAMTLFRGYADDMPLMRWLEDKIWPLEARLQPEDIYWGTMLCCLEMIRSGTTTFADMYFEMDQVARAVERSGMRAVLSRGLIGIGAGAEESLAESKEFVGKWGGAAGGRITTMFGPHAPYTCPPDYLTRVIEAAHEMGVGIHIHLAETRDEVERITGEYGKTPVQLMNDLGLFELPVLAAHCVHLDDRDIEILVEKKVGVAHNPESNMKLASGIAPVAALLAAGAIVGIGTDGAASNNNLDMVEEMRTAALLQKVATGNPEVLPALEVLRMATVGGAMALGLADVGQLAPGYKADIILVDLRRPHLFPRHDVAAHMVYSASSADVCTVMVDGKILMEDRKVLFLDEQEIYERVRRCVDRLLTTS